MSAVDIIRRCEALGATLRANGEYIHVEAAAPLPETLLAELRANKAAVLDALAPPPDDPIERIFWECRRLGVSLRLNDGDGPAFFARPRSAITPEFAALLRAHTTVVAAELIKYNGGWHGSE